MSRVVRTVRRRIDPTPLSALVAIGDLVLVGVFVVSGELSHNVDPLATPWIVVDTYVPFLLGWAVVALLGGLYTVDAWHSPKRAVAWTLPGWIAAVLIAQTLRATALFHGDAALPFFLVASGVGLALLLPWRVAVARLAGG